MIRNVVAAALTIVAIIPVWLAQRFGGETGLGEREPTAAGADTDEHGTSPSAA